MNLEFWFDNEDAPSQGISVNGWRATRQAGKEVTSFYRLLDGNDNYITPNGEIDPGRFWGIFGNQISSGCRFSIYTDDFDPLASKPTSVKKSSGDLNVNVTYILE